MPSVLMRPHSPLVLEGWEAAAHPMVVGERLIKSSVRASAVKEPGGHYGGHSLAPGATWESTRHNYPCLAMQGLGLNRSYPECASHVRRGDEVEPAQTHEFTDGQARH